MGKDMRSFVETLESRFPEEIVRISKGPIDPANGECTALLYHLMKQGKRPMAIFENVTNLWKKRWPGSVAFQVAGTWSKIGIGYGLKDPNDLLAVEVETAERVKTPLKPVVVGKREAPVKETVLREGVNFFDLPGYIGAEKDHRPGNFSGVVVIRDPETKRYNLSWHMNHVTDPDKLAMGISPRGHAWETVLKYRERGEEWAPIAQVFGHHVLFGLAAAIRCGLDVDEYDFAGGVLGEPVRLVGSETWGDDLLIPADAEVVMEGYVSTKQRIPKGLWCDALRYYIPGGENPLVKIAALNMRRDPIFEHNWVGYYAYTDIAIASFVRTMLASRFQGVGAVNVIAPTVVVVQFKPNNVGDVRRLANMAHAYGVTVKHVIVVDHDVDPFDPGMVLWAIGTRVDASKKAYIAEGLTPSGYDPSAEEALKAGEGIGALVIDCTKPIKKHFPEVGYPAPELMKKMSLEDYLPKEKVDRLLVGRNTRPWSGL
jgi:UbiD family decarboxylase